MIEKEERFKLILLKEKRKLENRIRFIDDILSFYDNEKDSIIFDWEEVERIFGKQQD